MPMYVPPLIHVTCPNCGLKFHIHRDELPSTNRMVVLCPIEWEQGGCDEYVAIEVEAEVKSYSYKLVLSTSNKTIHTDKI